MLIGAHVSSSGGIHTAVDRAVAMEADSMQVFTAMEQVLALCNDTTWLLVENSAGAGGTIGRSLDELALWLERLDHPRLGVCLDSCHLYVSGIDVTDRAVLDGLLDELDSSIG